MDKFINLGSLDNMPKCLINLNSISQLYVEQYSEPHYCIKLNNGDEYEIERKEYQKIEKLIEVFKI